MSAVPLDPEPAMLGIHLSSQKHRAVLGPWLCSGLVPLYRVGGSRAALVGGVWRAPMPAAVMTL